MIHDISLDLSNATVVWPGDAPVQVTRAGTIVNGQGANTSRLCFGSHAGTHVDAPLHFIEGASSVETLDLEILIGRAHLIDIDEEESSITASALERARIPEGAQRVLLRTRKPGASVPAIFDRGFVGIAEDAARLLVNRGIRLVGIDSPSVAPFEAPRATHEVLLSAGVVVVENLAYGEVPAGEYVLVCLPLRITGCDGSPARAVLMEVAGKSTG